MAKRLSFGFILIFIANIVHADTGLQVRLTSKAAKFSGEQDVLVTVEFTNTGDQSIRINTPAVPKTNLPDQLFTVSVDGSAVKYIGPVYKRVAPSTRHTINLEPGKSINGTMSLSSAYDLSKSGKYEVQYAVEGSRVIFGSNGKGVAADSVGQVQSNGLVLNVTGRPNQERVKMHQNADSKTPNAGTEYWYCTSTEQSQLANAKTVALNYATKAYNYLVVTTSRTLKRYPTWFGSYTQLRWNKVKSNFLKIKNSFASADVEFDCSCWEDDTYAYVYSSSPYVIYLCGAFWSAPMSGTDSKGGTLVHEMSHFNIVSDTDDHAYGHSDCKWLAKSSPSKAVQNADSHEYFAENTPAQS